ncbi:LytR C-terminal domain-containing protein [Dermatobacter hominis]|uniref:LytR C-terminal domain-containing protein n=1 Tax=Dermatobacter hominis TaxID=2884263 RepID=UPI001D11B362|nr:LytR C-terminal domain-containing protein [Dermatobacter hominis]UDY34574.1 LytR C-terminal domain-containing protein [Dermatobacter hominis]
MATTQRPRNPRSSAPPPGPNPVNRGLILIAVGVVLAVILLIKAGGAGFDGDSSDLEIGAGDDKVTTTTEATTTTVAEQAPQTVQVVAANGSGTSGLAAKTGQLLAQSGYTQVVATDSLQPVTASQVLYANGYEANAKSIAAALGLPETAVQPLAPGTQLAKNQPPTSGVIVMIGPDLVAKVNAGGTAGGTAGATTTTVAGGTGSTSGTGTGGATTTTVKSGTSTAGATGTGGVTTTTR